MEAEEIAEEVHAEAIRKPDKEHPTWGERIGQHDECQDVEEGDNRLAKINIVEDK